MWRTSLNVLRDHNVAHLVGALYMGIWWEGLRLEGSLVKDQDGLQNGVRYKEKMVYNRTLDPSLWYLVNLIKDFHLYLSIVKNEDTQYDCTILELVNYGMITMACYYLAISMLLNF